MPSRLTSSTQLSRPHCISPCPRDARWSLSRGCLCQVEHLSVQKRPVRPRRHFRSNGGTILTPGAKRPDDNWVTCWALTGPNLDDFWRARMFGPWARMGTGLFYFIFLQCRPHLSSSLTQCEAPEGRERTSEKAKHNLSLLLMSDRGTGGDPAAGAPCW